MNKMLKKVIFIIIIIYSVVVTILYMDTYNNLNKTNQTLKKIHEEYNIIANTEAPPILYTFYAQIENVDLENNTLLVKGLDFDTVYKNKYLLKISEETWLIGNGNTGGSNLLTLSCFEKNQYISVTYSGAIGISDDYEVIEKINKLQLLEDRNK